MTLQDFINQNNGKHVGDGQCVALVELYANEVLNAPLPVLPSAVNYWKVIPGYTQQSSAQVGDIAVYNSHTGFPDGHIAIVNQLGNPPQVFEQNADPDGSPAHLFNRSTIYLLGYLRKENMSTVTSLDLARILLYAEGGETGQNGTANALAGEADAQAMADFVGKPLEDVVRGLYNSPQGQTYLLKTIPSMSVGTVVPYSGPQLFVEK